MFINKNYFLLYYMLLLDLPVPAAHIMPVTFEFTRPLGYVLITRYLYPENLVS